MERGSRGSHDSTHSAQVTTQPTYMDEGSNIMQHRFQHSLVDLQVTVAKATLSKVENTAIRVGISLMSWNFNFSFL
jgi:hypothetical protein